MTVTVTSALAGPATARYSNVYGALVDLGVLSGLGAQDVTGSGDPVAPILNASEFYAPLTHSLILTRGTGNPTYSRATNAWEFDNEGKLVLVPSGAARFGGARLVRNLLTYTEDLSNAVYTSVNVTKTINSLTRASNAVSYVTHAITGGLVGATYSVRCKAKAKSTGNIIAIRLQGTYPNRADAMFDLSNGTVLASAGSTYVINSVTITGLDSDGYYTINLVATTVTSALLGVVMGPADSTLSIGGWEAASAVLSDCYIKEFQLENVTGQADQTASEYVSSGVLSAPYHGAGVDGCKWFNTNKDGSAISASSLLGYHAEGARTNSLLYSRDLTKFNYWITTGSGSEKCGNGTFDDATGWTLNANYSVSGGVLAYSAASGTNYASYGAIADYTPGKTYLVEFDYVYTSGNGPTFYIRGGTAAFSGATTSGHKQLVITCGSSAATALRLAMFSAGVWTVDNLTIKEAAIQVTTCTGLDNAANSASTLTANAADATILQTLTMAAAARSFSAYVKRRTGSGNVYITRDGGTNWTDITSEINSSTWTRVKIENTSVLNPSVGFKIATSGDAIDVDCTQDEAGAFITSPIITTTAAVTRNAENLTYVSGNIGNSAGTILITGKTGVPNLLGNAHLLAMSGGGGALYVNSASARTTVMATDNTNYVNKSGLSDITTVLRKQVVSYSAATMKVTGDGIAPTSGNYDGTLAGTMQVCGYDGTWNGYVKDVYIWSTALTDAQLQQVTA